MMNLHLVGGNIEFQILEHHFKYMPTRIACLGEAFCRKTPLQEMNSNNLYASGSQSILQRIFSGCT